MELILSQLLPPPVTCGLSTGSIVGLAYGEHCNFEGHWLPGGMVQ